MQSGSRTIASRKDYKKVIGSNLQELYQDSHKGGLKEKLKMTKTKEEKWVEKFGWIKVKGYKINLDELRGASQDDWDFFYLEKSDLPDYVEEVEFWRIDSDDVCEERCFEDVDSLIEFIEENSEERFAEQK